MNSIRHLARTLLASLILFGLGGSALGFEPVIKPESAKSGNPGKTSTGASTRVSKGKFQQEWDTVRGWQKDFPRLGDDFEVLAPGTENPNQSKSLAGTYNCIAHTAGIKTSG